MANNEKLIFPIGFDLEEGVRQVQKDWKKHQPEIQKTIDRNPLKLKLELSAKGVNISELKKYIGLSKEIAKANREIAKTRSANALAAQRESRQRVQEATELDQIKQKKAQASLTEERLAQAKQRSANATERQNSAYKTQSGYLQRLFQRMVAYASVTQAFSFIRNIREVTAQFELQRVALGSIIGDLNEANAMFEQIKAAAVKSPFQIKELVTYTKQLAAYKIESDELFETTQRLADVSAGLGVGMERLVLAYGQIRATGYLRASEVRQLTEAGIPIVEELAKKMSDLRGETVSAAEVMGLISERAISFGMVKEVFDDMTSAGGMFYKMQEKQAETLQGQWNNLKDSIAIMYEEIGNTEGVNNSIKGTIGLVKSLAENWRTVAVVMVTALEGYGVYKGFSALLSAMTYKTASLATTTKLHAKALERSALASIRFGKVGRLMTLHLRTQTKLLKDAAKATTLWGVAWRKVAAFLAGNIWNIALIGIGALVAKIVSAHIEANRLNKELERIGAEGDVQSRTQVNNFERLAKVIRDSADGSLRQTEALKEMKRAYGEFLPSQDKEIINLVRAKEGYEAVSQAIREKIALQVQEQKINAVTSEYSKIISDYLPDLKELLEPEGVDASRVYSVLKTAIEDGSLTLIGSVKEDAEAINAILEKELGITLNLLEEGRNLTIKGWKSVFNPSRAMELLRPILNAETKLRNAIQDIEYDLFSDTGITGIYAEKWDELQKNIKGITAKGEVGSFEWNKDKTRQEIELYHNFIKERIAEINKDLSDDKKIKFDIGDVLDFDALGEALGDNYPQLKQVVAKIQKEYEKLIPTDITRLANDKLKEYADKVGVSMDDVKEHLKTNEQSTEDWANGLKGAYESLEKKLAEYKLNRDNAIGIGKKTHWSKEVEKVEDEMKVLKLLMDFFKEFLSQSGGGENTNPRIAQLKDELSTVEKIYKEYQQLSKYGEEYANKTIAQMFRGVDLKYLQMATSPEKMRKVLEDALRMAKLEGDKELALEIQYKLGKFDADEKQRELEKNLKKLSDDLSRTKTAKEFFDRMLGMTGDKELSATLTMSVYGTTGDDLKSALVKQVEQAFKGVDVSGAIDYNTMTINYQKLAEIYAKNQDKILDANKSMAESIVKDGQKTSASQIEQWAKELEAVKTYADKRVDIARQTQQRISEIEASTLPEDEKQRLQEQYRKKEEKDLAELEYQAFKESPMYVAMFDNLDSASTVMLNNMRAKLMELKEAWGDLDMPTELKEMQSRLNEIDKQLASRNPFKTLANAYKGYQDLLEKGSRKEAEQDLIDKTEEHAKAVAQLGVLTRIAMQAQKAYDDAVKEHGKDSAQAKSAEQLLKTSNALVDRQKGFVNTTEDAVEKSQKLVNQWKELDDVVGGAWAQADMLAQSIIGLGRGIADALGGFGSEADAEFFDTMLTGFGDLASGVTSIGKGIASGNPVAIIQGVASAISGLANIFSAGTVREANEQIERQQKLLEGLDYSYNRLQKAQEKAFGGDYISNYEQRLANLQAQQEAYLKQAEKERSKGKKADEEKIKEYEKQARDTADAIKDMQSELSEHFLGTDLTSASRDFANAWIEAYKEFGSTTDAMKAKFQDMIQNMIVESFAARVIAAALEDVFDEIDKSMSDGIFDMSEAAKVANMTDQAIGNIDVGMNNLMNALSQAGISVRGMGSELTGISRDIATASEESILGLAAGINTQNFYISQVPPKLDTIIALLQGGGVQVGGGVNMQDLFTIQNQHLSYLPTIAQHTAETVAECKAIVVETRRTADALDKVIKPRGTQSSYTINTTLS